VRVARRLEAAKWPFRSATWVAAMTVVMVRDGGDLARTRRLGAAAQTSVSDHGYYQRNFCTNERCDCQGTVDLVGKNGRPVGSVLLQGMAAAYW
jgi:hypothetical protein